MSETQDWKKMGFTSDQIAEIERGVKAGFDVSVYAKKEFFAMQMRQIFLGLSSGIPVQIYAKPEYDWFQMEEIRKGIEKKIDIRKYASPSISYDKMRQIRKGLAVGIDLSGYQKLNAGILRELRKAALDRVRLVEYINQGYNVEQLEQIRIALAKGVDIAPYLSKTFLGDSIREIAAGLEDGLAVEIYAKPVYGWQQMREIRLGMEKRVDILKYSNPYYSWEQMHEIRLGLETNLSVKSYQSLMYTPREMRKRRLRQLNNQLQRIVEKTEEKSEGAVKKSKLPDKLSITINDNQMHATMYIEAGARTFTVEELKKALNDSGVKKGIIEENLKKLASGKFIRQNISVAKGKLPGPGKDGWYEFFFEVRPSRTPALLSDGSVDYKNTSWFEVTKKGQKIVTYHEAEFGDTGYTVTGKVLEAKKGNELSVLKGKGFVLLPDQKTYLSAADGRITYANGRLEISKVLFMQELTLATGDVNFDGDVYIKGNIGSGTKLRATGDVQVDGFVESAEIYSGKDILLKQGMNADGHGRVVAKGNVCGKFFETTTVEAGQDIQANYCLKCDLKAMRTIQLSGSTGTLAGGFTYAARDLLSHNVGNHVGLVTNIKLGVNANFQQKKQELNVKKKEIHEELSILTKAYTDMQKKYPPEVRNGLEMYMKIESAIFTKQQEEQAIQAQEAELRMQEENMAAARAVVLGTLYEGVRLEINGAKSSASGVKNITARRVGNRVAIYSNR